MAFKIENGKAIVPVEIDGKPGEIVLRKLKVREWAYSLDEFMTIKSGGGIDIKAGAMMIATLPKSIEKAPFEITNNNSVLDAVLGLDTILELTNALMELNGLGGETQKK